MTRRILLVTHANRPELPALATEVAGRLRAHGIEVHELEQGWDSLEDDPGVSELASEAELVVILGGDGTILRAAEVARGAGIPLLGINHGRVGFLAEAEREETAEVTGVAAQSAVQVETNALQAGRGAVRSFFGHGA